MKVGYKENREYRDFLRDKIKAFNNENSPFHRESRQENSTLFIQLKEEIQGAFAGGVTASIYWNMMFIDILFVEESHRGCGLGNKLLRELIDIARDKKCQYIALETYSFQAKDFYERHGFQVVGALEDYPPGETYYTMRLNLVTD